MWQLAYSLFRYASKKLTLRDCQPLFDKFQKRLSGWKSKVLSYAGHMELINSALSTLHNFWSIVFMLSKSDFQRIDRYIRNFLWDARGKDTYIQPIAWDSICLPKSHGGLGIKSVLNLNKASLHRRVWNVVLNKQTCWNFWLHAKYLHTYSFWDAPITASASWGWRWRHILEMRPLAMQRIHHLIGNGR
eukprot:TRINITY_DN27713_c0_g1_i3.p1 TRINITY_DN27713_c0_g1~~TRINITY_DN27713_c0_g1_i3.p1  ORF type:complete len:189 (+),score=14.42 TRINITY_DN27713_c0_g1_i3:725-1291(+)